MTQLGHGLCHADHYDEGLSVKEAELSMRRRLGQPDGVILAVQGNIAITYLKLGRLDEALRMRRDMYSESLKLFGEEHAITLLAALNYGSSLNKLDRFKEAKSLLRKAVPVARRVLGEDHIRTLELRRSHAVALHHDDGATLDDLSEAVTTLEETARTARRVMGSAHPLTSVIKESLQAARAALRAREPPSETS